MDSRWVMHKGTGMKVPKRVGYIVRGGLLFAAIFGSLSLSMASGIAEAQAGVSAESASRQSVAMAPGQSATLLPDGRWLLVGGTIDGEVQGTIQLRDGAALQPFPATLSVARTGHTATVLPNGTVLVAGGTGVDDQLVSGAELIDPVAGTTQTLAIPNLQPRAQATATLLTDGHVIFVGGLDASGQPIAAAQLWDPRTNAIDSATPALQVPRYSQTASLLPNGMSYIAGGKGAAQKPISTAEQFNPNTKLFEPTNPGFEPAASKLTVSAGIADSLPTGDAVDVPVDGQLAIRFNAPVNVTQLNSSTITLVGPAGAVGGRVAGAEGGVLAFFTPDIDLLPNTIYTLFISGIADVSGTPLAMSTVRFTTHRFTSTDTSATQITPATGANAWSPAPKAETQSRTRQSSSVSAKSRVAAAMSRLPATTPPGSQPSNTGEDWTPQERNRHGAWRVLGLSGDPSMDVRGTSIRDLAAQTGSPAIAGHVVRLNGKPLAGVTVSANGHSTTTDSNGRFLLTGVSAGIQQLKVDGTGVFIDGRHYTEHFLQVSVGARSTTTLPSPIFLPRVDPATEVVISSPADHEIILHHPAIPGLEVHIPRGAVLRTYDGKIVTRLSITPIPVDRAPYPAAIPFSVYFTLQPGGAYVDGDPSKAIRIIYPNYLGLPAGSPASFWNYDPGHGGWKVYGQGKVSPDGKTVIPDASVGFREIMTFGWGIGPGGTAAPNSGPPPGGCSTAADPVDCATGLFLHNSTDLAVQDVVPIGVTRMYRQSDTVSRAFGIGGNLSYAMWLTVVGTSGTAVDLVLADGGRVHYTGSSNVYTCTTSPTAFQGSVISEDANAHDWVLKLGDGSVMHFTPHVPNQLTSITDRFGNQVSITLSGSNVTQVTSPNGRYIQFTYDSQNRVTQATDNSGRSVSYTYDSSGRLATATDAAGFAEQYGYDPATNGMNAVTDRRGNLVTQNWFDSNGRVTKQQLADGAVWQFAYTLDGNGKVTQTTVTDPRGYIRQDTFNSSGYLTQRVLGQGQSVQQTYVITRGSNNFVQSETDTLNRKTSFGYDSFGNVMSITLLTGTPNAVTYSYQYDATFHQLVSVRDPLSHGTSMGVDSLGSITSISDALGHTVQYAYNPEGLLTQMTDPLNHTFRLSYSGGDLTGITNGLGSTTSLFTDSLGRVAAITDPLGNVTQVSYDPLDRVLSSTDPLGGEAQMSYDPNGNMLTAADPRKIGNDVWTYDARNRPHTYTDPDGNITTYNWDGMGNLTSKLDAKQQLTTYTYDALDRLTLVTYADGASVSITWDAGNRAQTITDSANGTVQRTFDLLDRLTLETGPQGQTSYQYDAASRRTQLTVNGQSTPIQYGYDNANRLTSVTYGAIVAKLGYDNADRRTSVTLPNGIVETVGFDNANHLTSISYDKGTTHVGDLAYSYDAAGHRSGQSGTFAKLLMPNPVANATYDAANRLTNWGGIALSYDANGNLASAGNNSLTWNARDQLVATAAGNSTFSYDATGRRASSTVSGVSTSYLWDGPNPASVNSNLVLAGLGVDDDFARVTSGVATSFLTDAQGNTLSLTDSTATMTASYQYEPYGSSSTSGTDGTPFQFAGRDNDGASGLYYYRARYYSPTFERFISSDPAGLAGGINRYAYTGGDPISHIDPSGLFITSVDAACTIDPNFCAEIMGTIVHNAAAISGDGCQQEAANAVAGAFQTVGNIASILPALPAAKGLTTLVRDATGKIHTPVGTSLPSVEDLKNTSAENIRETVDELRASIQAREQELQRLGEDPAHRARIEQERSLLRSLEKYLGGFF
jgi:RHS repeat-associated protein